MSTLRVEIAKIEDVQTHPNADRLDLAKVFDWSVVVGKGSVKVGDAVIYIPIDSVLAPKLEEYLFPKDSKIKLDKSRVRSIKIRQAVSQGMIVERTPELEALFPGISKKKLGDDVAELLGVTKYEPPVQHIPGHMKGRVATHNNPAFNRYTDIDDIKWHKEWFQPNDEVWISEKLHGTNARYAILPTNVYGIKKHILKWLHLLPKYEFCYGSHNVQLQAKKNLYYAKDVYSIIAKQLGIESRLLPGETLYGEIVGSGIQKGYTYGCKQDEWKFFVFDVKKDGRYLNVNELFGWCSIRGFEMVPTLYAGPYKDANLEELVVGDSLVGGQKVREGVVIKPGTEVVDARGRKVLKYRSAEYLLKDQSDFH